jgi:hypothetical protein
VFGNTKRGSRNITRMDNIGRKIIYPVVGTMTAILLYPLLQEMSLIGNIAVMVVLLAVLAGILIWVNK